MKKTFTFLLAAMMLLMVFVIPMKVWADTATFGSSDFSGQGTSNTGSEISATVSGVTFACDKGYGTTEIRCYSGGTITISSTNTITGLSFTFSGGKTGGLEKSYTNLSTTEWTYNLPSQARFSAIVVTYTPSTPAYTITAQSNNPNYGTVSLDGSVITGSPKSGCRYADPAYTISPANSATVSQNGNYFTVNPSANTTVTINFEAIPTYTVILADNDTELTEESAGAGVTLPSRNTIGVYSFTGWSETNVSQETTSAPTIISAGTYHPTSNITLYPVYTRTESSSGTTDVPVSVTISEYATTNGWGNSSSSGQKSITIDENVTATCNSGTNSGKYYDNGWRIYQTEDGAVTITTTNGTLKSVTFTFTVANTGTFNYNSSGITSGTAVNVSGTSAEFTVGNSTSATNGQVRITVISVTYTVTGTITITYYLSSPVAPSIATPTFTPASGTYTTAQSVTIACETSGSTIYYTNDGTEPTNESTQYNNSAINIATTTTIKAVAYVGNDASAVATALYTIKPYSVIYNSNGVEVTVNQETSVFSLAAPTNVPVGFTFAGWTIYETELDVNNILEGETIDLTDYDTDNATLVAVFSREEGAVPGDFELVTESLTDWSGNYLIAYNDETFADGRIGGTSGMGNQNSSVNPGTNLSDDVVNANWGNTYYVTLEKVGGNTEGYLLKTQDGKYNYQTSNSNGLPSTDNRETAAGYPLSVTLDVNGYLDIAVSAGAVFHYNTQGYFRFYKDGGQGKVVAYKQSVTPGVIKYYTRVYPENATVTEDIIITGPTIIESGVTLNMGLNTLSIETGGNLIIEDGGQLILKDGDDDVAATVKKNITAPTEWNQNDKTGWYAISSTVGTISDITNSSFSNDFAPDGEFDLYKYVESSNNGYGWINYNNPAQTSTFGGLVNGQGYLYARKDGATVSFTGNVNHTDVTLTGLTAKNSANENLRGIHLIGNPYTHNIYKGVALTATKGAMSSTYYRLDGNNLWVVESDDNPIGPGQGFLVKVTDGTDLTFRNNASAPGSKANNDYIRFAVSNSEYEDATFALFQKGEGLRKINHRNTEAPMIYISQNDANYASATMDDDTKSFNLNFEAKTMGQYKLSYKVNGEFNYLHVIDRATGEDIDMLLEGSYSFIGSPMDNPSRFIVRLGYLPNYDDNGQDIFAYQNGNDIVVSGEGELQIFDVMGRKVSTMNIYGIETVNGLAQGVYIFRLEGKTQKIVVR